LLIVFKKMMLNK